MMGGIPVCVRVLLCAHLCMRVWVLTRFCCFCSLSPVLQWEWDDILKIAVRMEATDSVVEQLKKIKSRFEAERKIPYEFFTHFMSVTNTQTNTHTHTHTYTHTHMYNTHAHMRMYPISRTHTHSWP